MSHAERITCFALTADSQHVVTGSMDMSLKVWKLDGGKLSQVWFVKGQGTVNVTRYRAVFPSQSIPTSLDCVSTEAKQSNIHQ